ncbi:MAG: hypothetical protein KF773_06725 [Deltaproteobacteria bacterium]|nr:hypothetical protein [Deltaproteobacteria bacterium]
MRHALRDEAAVVVARGQLHDHRRAGTRGRFDPDAVVHDRPQADGPRRRRRRARAHRAEAARLGPTYEILRGDELVAVVKKKLFIFLRTTFTMDVPGPDDLVAEGNFTDHEYRFLRGTHEAAHVSKTWFTLGDVYGIEVESGEDAVLVIESAVVTELVVFDA